MLDAKYGSFNVYNEALASNMVETLFRDGRKIFNVPGQDRPQPHPSTFEIEGIDIGVAQNGEAVTVHNGGNVNNVNPGLGFVTIRTNTIADEATLHNVTLERYNGGNWGRVRGGSYAELSSGNIRNIILRFGRLDEGEYRIVINDELESENGIAAPPTIVTFTAASHILVEDDFSNNAIYPLNGNPNTTLSPFRFESFGVNNDSRSFEIRQTASGKRYLHIAPEFEVPTMLYFDLPMTFSGDAVLSARSGIWASHHFATRYYMRFGAGFPWIVPGPLSAFGFLNGDIGGGFLVGSTDRDEHGFVDTLLNFTRDENENSYYVTIQTESSFANDRNRVGIVESQGGPVRHLYSSGTLTIGHFFPHGGQAQDSYAQFSYINLIAGIRPRVLHVEEQTNASRISFFVNDDLNLADFARRGNFQVKSVSGNREIAQTATYDPDDRKITINFNESLTPGEEYRVIMRDFTTATMMRMPESFTFTATVGGFGVLDWDFLNQSGNVITTSDEISAATSVVPKFTIVNNAEIPTTFRAFLAIYNNEIFVDVAATEIITIASGEELRVGAGWDLESDAGHNFRLYNLEIGSGNQLRLFIWDENMTPLSMPIIIPQEETDETIMSDRTLGGRIVYNLFPGGVNKAFNFTIDDGNIEDRRIIEIFNNHGIKGTFNLTPGWFSNVRPSPWHITSQEVRDGLYDGHEVASHGFEHLNPRWEASYKDITEQMWIEDLRQSREMLEDLGITDLRGFAFPDGAYSARHGFDMARILQEEGFVYARVLNNGSNNLPNNFFHWHTTSWLDGQREPLVWVNQLNSVGAFINAPVQNNLQFFSILMHGFDVRVAWAPTNGLPPIFQSEQEAWDAFEGLVELVANRNDIWSATFIEVYDYNRALERIVVTDRRIINPSAIPVWVTFDGQPRKIEANSSINVQ